MGCTQLLGCSKRASKHFPYRWVPAGGFARTAPFLPSVPVPHLSHYELISFRMAVAEGFCGWWGVEGPVIPGLGGDTRDSRGMWCSFSLVPRAAEGREKDEGEVGGTESGESRGELGLQRSPITENTPRSRSFTSTLYPEEEAMPVARVPRGRVLWCPGGTASPRLSPLAAGLPRCRLQQPEIRGSSVRQLVGTAGDK